MPADSAPDGNASSGGLREESRESRWEAAPAVVCVIGLQVLLAVVSRQGDWKLWSLPWWVWLVPAAPELVVLAPLAFDSPRHQLEQMGHRRTAAMSLFAVISLANILALVALIGSLLSGEETSGTQLLFKAVTIWTTNALAYGLWYWGIDRGGPVRRLEPDPPLP